MHWLRTEIPQKLGFQRSRRGNTLSLPARLSGLVGQIQFFQNIVGVHDQLNAILNQPIAAPTGLIENAAWNGKDVASLLGGHRGSDERAALFWGFNDQHRVRKTTDESVAPGKISGFGPCP